ncbi:MAG: hypothetical protein K8R40_02685 [Anaerolineaceae bacterium]|nr:hypothetical protein [Anaerolineaceae bacterium]
MEIEFSRDHFYHLLVVFIILVLIGFGCLGKAVTPDDLHLFSWEEWHIYKAHRQLAVEQHLLSEASSDLSDLLNHLPDPIRAQFTMNRILDLYNEIHSPSSLLHYDALLVAAGSVQDWSMGIGELEAAQEAVQSLHLILTVDGK